MDNVVKVGPEGEPERVAAHGSYGQTNGQTVEVIIKGKYEIFNISNKVTSKQ